MDQSVQELHCIFHSSEKATSDNSCPQQDDAGEEKELAVIHQLFHARIVEVGGAAEGLKCWIFKNGLRQHSSFREKLGHRKGHSLKQLLNRV